MGQWRSGDGLTDLPLQHILTPDSLVHELRRPTNKSTAHIFWCTHREQLMYIYTHIYNIYLIYLAFLSFFIFFLQKRPVHSSNYAKTEHNHKHMLFCTWVAHPNRSRHSLTYDGLIIRLVKTFHIWEKTFSNISIQEFIQHEGPKLEKTPEEEDLRSGTY